MQISTFSDAHEFISYLKSKVEHESSTEMTIENSWQKLINERDELMKPSQIAAADVSMLTAEPLIEAEPVDISMNSDPSSVIFDDIDFDELPFPSQITWTWTQEPEIAPADVIEKGTVEEEHICDEFEFELDWALTQRIKASQEQDEQPKEQFIGFTTGTGRALPPPSEEAMKRAQQLTEEPLDRTKEEITFGFTTGKGKSLPPPSKEALERAKQLIEDTPSPPPESFGFTTGNGKAMPPPSEAAMKRAQSLINDTEKPQPNSFSVGFSTGKGRILPPPSNEAMKRAKSLIESAETELENPSFSAGFSTGKGRILPPPSKEALLKAQQLTSSLIDDPLPPAVSLGFSSGNGRLLPPPSKEALERANRLIQSKDKENIPAPIVSIKPTPKPIIPNNRSSLSTAFRRPRQQQLKPPSKSSSSIIPKVKPTSLFDLKSSQPRQKLAQYFSLPTRHSPIIYAQFNM